MEDDVCEWIISIVVKCTHASVRMMNCVPEVVPSGLLVVTSNSKVIVFNANSALATLVSSMRMIHFEKHAHIKYRVPTVCHFCSLTMNISRNSPS